MSALVAGPPVGATASLVDRVRARLAASGAGTNAASVAAAVRAEAGGIASDLDVLAALRVLRQEFVGAGPLDELLRDPRTTDVLVSGPQAVWVDRGGGLERTPVRFADDAAVRRLAQRLALAAGRRLDDASPFVDGWLAEIGVRLHAVLAPVAAGGTCLSLRVLRPSAHDLAALRALGSIGTEAEGLLRAVLAARLAFVVSGGTGTGNPNHRLCHTVAVTDASPVAAAIYARISQDRTGAGLGVDRQVDECQALAERLGWDVVTVHRDNDLSAYSGKPRPGYKALLSDVAAGRVNGVLAWHTDRLHRSPAELEGYITACEARGVPTHTVQAGHLDLSTPSGRLVARNLGAAARYESEHKSARVTAARRQAALAGKWPGGKRAYGYDRFGNVVPEEAAEIRRLVDEVLGGTSLRTLVRDLNGREIPTCGGAKWWSGKTLRDTLTRPRLAGLSVHQGEIVGRGQWEPIVPEDRWRALVAMLADPMRRTSPGAEVRWLGSGLYRCALCERPSLRVSMSGGRNPKYRCNARLFQQTGTVGHVVRSAVEVDAYVGALVVERLSRDDAGELRQHVDGGPDVGQLQGEAVALRERLTELSTLYAEGAVTAAQLTDGTAKLRARLDVAERRIADAAATDPLGELIGAEALPAVWEGLDLGRKRLVVDALMEVTILPATRRGRVFDPNAIRIRWKR